MARKDIAEELKQIAKTCTNEILLPQAVVDFARDPDTALHSRFTWDDSEAAEKYRLQQARNVINVYVVMLPNNEKAGPIKQWVHLRSDRSEGGGYRSIVSVVSDKDLKEELLEQALVELRTFRRKYEQLKELRPIFETIRQIEATATARRGAKSVSKRGAAGAKKAA